SDGQSQYDIDESEAQKDRESISVISGEKIYIGDKEISAFDPLPVKELFSDGKTNFKKTSLEQLLFFIDCFNQFGIRFGLFKDDHKLIISEENKKKIAEKIREHFIKLARKDENKRKIEPVFIQEIKLIFELLREQMG
ncbi:MAG: hypothetical protein ACE5I1_12250, partial [bacterium]